MLRELRFPALSDVFTLRPVEALGAGASVVADGLDALSFFAAGRFLARGCIAQCPLLSPARLIIPLAGGRQTLDVDFHAVLVVLLVVGLVVSPVLSLLRESLFGSHPGPVIIDLSDPNPVVRAIVRYDVIEVSNLIFILDGH